MSHEEGLLQAIIDEPDDDGLRLIYADWLEERGDPRGEFIRVQIELARLPEYDPRRFELEEREQSLLAEHEREWLGAVGREVSEWQFRRGFVEWVSMHGPAFAANAEAVFRLTPLQSVSLSGARGVLAEIGQCPLLGRLRGLNLDHQIHLSETDLQTLLSSRLEGLRALRLGDCGLDLSAIERLAGAPVLAALTELHLEHNTLTDVSFQVLAEARHWGRLRVLGLGDNRSGDAGVRALAYSPHFPELMALDLNRNRFGNVGVEALALAASRARLTHLNLCGNHLGRSTAMALAESSFLRSLTHIDLGKNSIGSTGARALRTPRT